MSASEVEPIARRAGWLPWREVNPGDPELARALLEVVRVFGDVFVKGQVRR